MDNLVRSMTYGDDYYNITNCKKFYIYVTGNTCCDSQRSCKCYHREYKHDSKFFEAKTYFNNNIFTDYDIEAMLDYENNKFILYEFFSENYYYKNLLLSTVCKKNIYDPVFGSYIFTSDREVINDLIKISIKYGTDKFLTCIHQSNYCPDKNELIDFINVSINNRNKTWIMFMKYLDKYEYSDFDNNFWEKICEDKLAKRLITDIFDRKIIPNNIQQTKHAEKRHVSESTSSSEPDAKIPRLDPPLEMVGKITTIDFENH